MKHATKQSLVSQCVSGMQIQDKAVQDLVKEALSRKSKTELLNISNTFKTN
jgi:hypothetical protein